MATGQPWFQEVGIRLGAAAAIAPKIAPGAGAFWGIGPARLPRIRVSAQWYDRQVTDADSNAPRAHFSLFSLVTQLCWGSRVAHASAFALAGCGGLEGGFYRVHGVSPDSDNEIAASATTLHQRNLFWAAAVLSVPLRYMSRDVFLEITPDIRAPLVRARFEYQNPYRLVHSIPAVAMGLGLAMGLSFP